MENYNYLRKHNFNLISLGFVEMKEKKLIIISFAKE